MKLLKITGCGDCPHFYRKEVEEISGLRTVNVMGCRLLPKMEYRFGTREYMEFDQFKMGLRKSESDFVIPGCPLPDADAKEEKK